MDGIRLCGSSHIATWLLPQSTVFSTLGAAACIILVPYSVIIRSNKIFVFKYSINLSLHSSANKSLDSLKLFIIVLLRVLMYVDFYRHFPHFNYFGVELLDRRVIQCLTIFSKLLSKASLPFYILSI